METDRTSKPSRPLFVVPTPAQVQTWRSTAKMATIAERARDKEFVESEKQLQTKSSVTLEDGEALGLGDVLSSSSQTRTTPSEIGNSVQQNEREVARPYIRRASIRKLLVNSRRQKGNPVLRHLINVSWEFAETEPDFVIGSKACVLYLSLKYHRLKGGYIEGRIRTLGNWQLSVLLVLVDVEDTSNMVSELGVLALKSEMSLVLAFSIQEAARYIETFKAYENKPATFIKQRVEKDYMSQLIRVLTSSRGVNKTDVATLSSRFGSLKKVMDASMEELLLCPGLGEKKVKRLHETFHMSFKPEKRLQTKKITEYDIKDTVG